MSSSHEVIFKALGHPVRRQILLTFKFRGERMSAGDIASCYSCRWPTIARHLAVLMKADLIAVEREGRSRIYSLNKTALREVLEEWISYFEFEKDEKNSHKEAQKGAKKEESKITILL
jgi:DNA-binding transcriptional ArsR family regulator